MNHTTENFRAWRLPTLFLLSLVAFVNQAAAQTFTLQIGASPLPPTALVNHGDTWRYRPARTNAPQVDWRTDADAALDGTWLSATGGFGFGDPAIVGEATTLSNMLNNYSSLAIRREFTIAGPLDLARRIQLTVDYDDGYVAWLDGVEISRSPNTAGLANPPPYNASTVSANHEASCCGAGVNPATVLDLGPVGARLSPGPHVFALQGINSGSNSSDFHLIADLALIGGTGAAQDGAFFSLVNAASTSLSGTNTLPGATRVAVNGVDASYNPGTGQWSKTQALQPGMNRLFIAALDAGGNILYSTNRDVVSELATIGVGGVLAGMTIWDVPGTTVRVTNDVIVADGAQLQISNGVVVMLAATASIRVETNGILDAIGAPGRPVSFLPADGSTAWRQLSAQGNGSLATLRHADIVAGQVRVLREGSITVEDSTLRDIYSRQMCEATDGAQFTFRRCHFNRFAQCHFDYTPTLIEDCLIENVTSDATDFAGFPAEIIIRRTTYRFGFGSNTDAIDTGMNFGLTVDSCLVRDFPDKGVSIAEQSHGTVVKNSLLFNNGESISCYGSSNCVFEGNTIYNSGFGLLLRERTAGQGAGHAVGSNNIVWGCLTNVSLLNGSTLALDFSDVGGALAYPGTGNINADPLFLNPAAGDFRLAAGSPAAGAGEGGADMGVASPVGGIPAGPTHLAAHAAGVGMLQIWWREDADNEAGFQLERSSDGAAWMSLIALGRDATNYTDTTAVLDQTYFYRVRATNSSGGSDWSNLASARRGAVINVVCGTLTANATWSPAQGEFLVCSNVTVPANITLTILPGTVVRLTNGSSLRAIAGGVIDIAGTEDNKVVLQSLAPGVVWKELSAQFAGASLTVRHADISGGQVTVYSNAVGLIEDSFIHDYRPGGGIFNACIMLTHFAAPTTIRRCHIREYHETLFRNGVLLIEDCLFENIYGDGLDFDAAQPGTVLRRSTFRHGNLGNVDAVDVGPADLPGSLNVLIADCLMYDFPFDKGVSVGDRGDSFGTVVSNSLIYGCQAGIMAKDSCDVTVIHCTIVNNRWGFTNYNKDGSATFTGGYTTNYNSILWDNITTVSMRDGGTLDSDHSILGQTAWPGTGNFSADPLFMNPAQRDYRLQPGSPAVGAGRNGTTLGVTYPVGAAMALSHPRIDSVERQGAAAVLRFWADNERTYSVLCSEVVSGGSWARVADIGLGTVPRRLSITNSVPGAENRFYRLVSPRVP